MTRSVVVRPPSTSSRLANPKSVILGVPSASNRMFRGVRSRWTTPARCAAWTAHASVMISSAAGRGRLGRASQPLCQTAPLEQFEREVGEFVDLSDVIDLHDVGVAEPRDGLGLNPEPIESVRSVPGIATDHLQGDQAVEQGLARLEDHTHAAMTEYRQDLVTGNHGERGPRWVGSTGRIVERILVLPGIGGAIASGQGGTDLTRGTAVPHLVAFRRFRPLVGGIPEVQAGLRARRFGQDDGRFGAADHFQHTNRAKAPWRIVRQLTFALRAKLRFRHGRTSSDSGRSRSKASFREVFSLHVPSE